MYNYNVDVSGIGRPPPYGEGMACDIVMPCRFESYRLHHFINTHRHIMKKALAVILVLLTSTANAQWSFDNSGGRIFDMRKNTTNKTLVTIKHVKQDRVDATCKAEAKKYGLPEMKYGSLACTFFWDDKCVIIVPEKVDMRTIGHEVMHCFQGDWHAGKYE